MVTVEYPHQFNYREFDEGSSPILTVTMSRLDGADDEIDVDAYLDSGASRSLFNGSFLRGWGLTLMNDKRKVFTSTSGNGIEAYLHRVRITLPAVGPYELDIGFSNGQISRNLLGRDFLNLVQVGFRENRLQFYLHPSP